MLHLSQLGVIRDARAGSAAAEIVGFGETVIGPADSVAGSNRKLESRISRAMIDPDTLCVGRKQIGFALEKVRDVFQGLILAYPAAWVRRTPITVGIIQGT